MLEETGFIAREEGDEFLILTCPACNRDIIFTQLADPTAICETANTHAHHCAEKRRPSRPRLAEVAVTAR